MARNSGSKSSGHDFTEAETDAVFEKGTIVPGKPKEEYRLDAVGAIIQREMYGDTEPEGTGWEIDHIKPVSKGGSDTLSNLQPLQWQNNRTKGDDWPDWQNKGYTIWNKK